MKLYKGYITFKEHGFDKEYFEERYFILDDEDDINEYIQMFYGSYYDILKQGIQEMNKVSYNINFINKQKLIREIEKL